MKFQAILFILFTSIFCMSSEFFLPKFFNVASRQQQRQPPLRFHKTPTIALLVEIPVSTIQYNKPVDVKAGGRFVLETPMKQYTYSSAGKSNLRRVQVIYLMQSIYRPNQMCFFLHFWSIKDATVPWSTGLL